MGGDIDFAKLYGELGVLPDCGLEAFKQAYRRRVAELHPDRPASRPRDPGLLIALNLGYAAVLDFHRGQGRLPGASAAAGARSATGPQRPGAPPPHAPDGSHAMPYPAAQSGRRVPRMRVLLLPVLLLIAAIWHWLPTFDDIPPAPAAPAMSATAAAAVPGSNASSRPRAQLGMDQHTVAALIGEPVARSADDSRWVYGPSWVYFECNRLADWYSSPLQPLQVGSRTPSAEEKARYSARGVVACPRREARDASRLQGDD